MLKIERKANIMNFLKKQKIVQVKKLAEQLKVTTETVRNDLSELEIEGYIKRHHGGAILNSQIFDSISLQDLINYPQLNEQSINTQRLKNMHNHVFILGSFNVDITNIVPHLPAPGESVLALYSSFSPGGKGANQALAASCSLSDVYFVTKIGQDEFNHYAKRYFENSKISNYKLFESVKSKTGCAVILVSNESGENCISISPGANMEITNSEVDYLEDEIKNSTVMLLQLETNINAIKRAIDIARKNNVKVILNPAPYNDSLLNLLSDIDIITPNETEATLISKVHISDIESAQKAAQKIYQMGVKIVIITLGAKGALCFDGEQFIFSPAYPAVVKNTSGAGDAFNGAFAASLAQGKALLYSLQYASAFASLAVETDSASGMPHHQMVLDRINQNINKVIPKTFI
ncbi:PfkB family carbohydrate kinase [Orbus sturtevantii]|uniref:PfkB family carbohydrate kinase n=1 Tax=Orbus sturtevantii TaxID=3074109 RepID=UPI00370DCFEF